MLSFFQKYLDNYGHPRIHQLTFNSLSDEFDYAVCIPSCAEENNFIPLLNSLAEAAQVAKKSALALLLINSSSKDSHILDSNLKSFVALGVDSSKDSHILDHSKNLKIFIVNAAAPLERLLENGVGEARKLLGDLAVKLYVEKKLRSPWIRSVDADLEVSTDYFIGDKQLSPQHTYTYPFKHIPQGEAAIDEATALYERYLHHYVSGLKWAESPYDFYALGSILLFHVKNYVDVRGFPSRNAAEDFYFLNKLAKNSKVLVLENQRPIKIRARISNRVPFGTGASVAKIKESGHYSFYNQEVFEELRKQLLRLEDFSQNLDWPSFCGAHESFWSPEKAKIEKLCRNFKKAPQRHKALHDYFDAFKTLKFLHYLREYQYPSHKISVIATMASNNVK